MAILSSHCSSLALSCRARLTRPVFTLILGRPISGADIHTRSSLSIHFVTLACLCQVNPTDKVVFLPSPFLSPLQTRTFHLFLHHFFARISIFSRRASFLQRKRAHSVAVGVGGSTCERTLTPANRFQCSSHDNQLVAGWLAHCCTHLWQP